MDLSVSLEELIKTMKQAREIIEKQLINLKDKDINQKVHEKAIQYNEEGAPEALANNWLSWKLLQ